MFILLYMNKIPCIVICGPTASGKTAVSLSLSNYLDIEIISADSRQIYKYLNIGTAKPTSEELQKVTHHFIDFIEPNINYSAGQFGNDAYSTILEISKRNKIPIIVGGSGLYIKSLCEGLFDSTLSDAIIIGANESHISKDIRSEIEKEFNENGIDFMYEKLKKIDFVLWKLYSDKNPRRIKRALEYYYLHNKKLSNNWNNKQDRTNITPIYYCINPERDFLYDKINKRVDIMWENGLVEETEYILNMGFSSNLNALNTVGYKETIKFLLGECSEEMAIEEIKKNTRRYAKRQLTWFRKNTQIKFFDSNFDNIQKIIIDKYRNLAMF